jgi:RNA polymerase sigma-70 factor, ECF subfamily
MKPGDPNGLRPEDYQKCCRRYPAVEVSFETLGARAASVNQPPDQLHLEDLFLACACGAGDRVAWEIFLDEYLPQLHQWAVQACNRLQGGEDLSQDIVALLLEDRRKLASYDGRGRLASWLRVMVSRAAIDRIRKTRRDISLDEQSEQGQEPAAGNSLPPDEAIGPDARWGPILARSLELELKSLPPRDRLMLGLYYLDGLPLKKIGEQLGVHEATASRWLDGIRNQVKKAVEKQLRRLYGLKPSEIASLWGWAAENDQFSLKRILE